MAVEGLFSGEGEQVGIRDGDQAQLGREDEGLGLRYACNHGFPFRKEDVPRIYCPIGQVSMGAIKKRDSSRFAPRRRSGARLPLPLPTWVREQESPAGYPGRRPLLQPAALGTRAFMGVAERRRQRQIRPNRPSPLDRIPPFPQRPLPMLRPFAAFRSIISLRRQHSCGNPVAEKTGIGVEWKR
jgi:hypothetical protein